jgi:glycosyltransferase 2 family protein
MKKRGRLYVAIGVLSSAIFIVLAVRRLDFSDVARAFQHAELVPWLPLAVLSYITGHFVRGVRCRLLVSREAKLSLSTATNVVVFGYAVNNVLPARLGEFARAGLLAQTSGLPFVQSLTVTLLERVLDGLCLLLLLVVAGRMVPDVDWIHTTLGLGGLIFGIAAFGVLLAVAAPSTLLNVTSRVTHRFGTRLHGVGVTLVSQLVAGVSYIRTLSTALSISGLSVLVWLCEAGMFLALMPAFGIPANPWFALLAMCVTNLGILVPSTPGFIGAFHAFCMMAVMLAGVAEPVAFSYAALVHLSFYVPITLWGIAIAFTYGLSFGEMANRAAEARPIEAGAEQPLVSLRPARELRSAEPSRFFVTLVEALLPEDAALAARPRVVKDVAEFVQTELGDLPARLGWLLAIGLTGFRAITLLVKLRTVEALELPARRAWVETWAYGSFGLARQLFRGVRSTALLGYYDHPLVRAELIPQEKRGARVVTLETKRTHGAA